MIIPAINSDRLAKTTACFLTFSSDPLDNINKLTALCGEELGAACALYNRFDNGMLRSWGLWNPPPGYKTFDRADGHICYDVIRKPRHDVYLVRNLQLSPYADSDANVRLYNLQSYMGAAAILDDQCVGSLCVVFQHDFNPDESDKNLLLLLAQAISIEEKRKQVGDLLNGEKEKLEKMTGSIGAGLVIISPDYQVLWANKVIQDIFGHVEGKKCHLAFNRLSGICPDCGVRKVLENNLERYVHEQTGIDINGRQIWSKIIATPLRNGMGAVESVLEVVLPITESKMLEEAHLRLITELKNALIEVKKLSGMLPICSSCKKIRDDEGYWNQIEKYIRDHSEARFSHSICPQCARQLYADFLGARDFVDKLSFRIVPEKNLIHVMCNGHFSVEEIKKGAASLYADPQFRQGMDSIVDLSRATLEIDFDKFNALAAFIKANEQMRGKCRVGVIVTSDVIYAIIRMISIFAATSTMSIYPFNRYDEAVDWINQARDGNRITSLDIASKASR
ncbi:MAG: PAS domain-containing protein [Deltaproteobacteria bacterium]|nr:PAS domain-containing protein [Deltaproteobacteria bacterium]